VSRRPFERNDVIVAVSGGLSGIGAAIVDNGSARGWTMRGGSRRNGLDVRYESSIHAFVHGPVDAAVACAGVSVDALFVNIGGPDIKHVIRTNVDGAFLFARAAIRHGARSVLFIGSLSQLGAPGNAVYAASKAALVGLARAMTLEYPLVHVNVLVPGFVVTPMTASLSDAAKQRLRTSAPIGRAVDVDEVARAATEILLSSLRGRVIRVTGGLLETPI
jgi:3-oxoacyl-[acyl-carrier protein] reductase